MPIAENAASLQRILKTHRTIAVVGLSANWYRPSFFAAKYLQDHGYQIVPVNPNCDEILNCQCYPSLAAIPKSIEIDVVDVFQRSEMVMPIAEAAIAIRAKVLWLQIGVINEAAVRMGADAGLEVVVDRCMKIEHARLFGGLNFVGVDTQIISSARPNLIQWQ